MLAIKKYAASRLPTASGEFEITVFRDEHDDEHVALVYGGELGDGPVLARVHSECLTGEVFGSLRCDCRAQLDLAIERIADEGRGVVVYLRQEGRGIGLGNKIRAYALQDEGKDTVAANESLGFDPDQRDYRVAAAIFGALGISRVRLLTNNPEKVSGLEANGIEVVERVPHWTGESPHNERYLAVKRDRMGHMSDADETASEAG